VDAGFIYDKSFCDTRFTEIHDKRELCFWCGLKELINFSKAVCIMAVLVNLSKKLDDSELSEER
jgi:hypothetical protein